MSGTRLKITAEFEAEAEATSLITHDLKAQHDQHIKNLFEKAKENNWYDGPDVLIEELLYDFCENTWDCRSWKNFSGAVSKRD